MLRKKERRRKKGKGRGRFCGILLLGSEPGKKEKVKKKGRKMTTRKLRHI